MKILKYLAFIVLALLGVYLILCGTGPKKMDMTQSISIQASPNTVFDLVSDFNKWSQWSPWAKKDINAKYTFTGEPMTAGHSMSWEGNEDVGSGTQKIVDLKQNELVKSELKFKDFGDEASYASFIIKPEGEGTKLTWTMESSEMPFMVRGLAKLMNFQAALEKDYVAGLAAIKEISEKAPKAKAFDFEVIDIADMHYLGKRFPSIKEADVNAALFESTYGALGKAIGGMDKMAGMPFSIGHSFDPVTHIIDLEMALPIAAEMKAPEGMTYGKVPAGKAAKYVYYGPYEGTASAWMPFMEAIAKKNHKPRFDGYEVYANDPTTVKSPSEIMTWLIVPIE
jgi:effector-binding domain-containing protein